MGLNTTRIDSDGRTLELERDGQRRSLDISSPGAIAAHTGWELPLQALPHWLKGVPAPGRDGGRTGTGSRRTSRESLHPGRLAGQLPGVRPIPGRYSLPTRMRIHRGDTSARLIIRRWEDAARLMALSLPAPAKLNLFLHITGRRPDGYHRLQTLFQLLDFGDTLHFTPNRCPGGDPGRGPGVDPSPGDNLMLRAARALAPDRGGVHIQVHKRIPAGGGLGGGSSDAATTLLALNHLWQLGYSNRQLQAIGVELGADVPVFVAGSSAWAEGIGEQLTPVSLPERHFLVIAPNCQVSTREIFSRRELTRDSAPIKIAAFFEGTSRNDLQSVVRNLHPEVDNALKWLENFGEAKLTGSGACIFAEFAGRAEAERVLAQMPGQWRGFTARGINTSPLHEALALID